MTRLWDLAERYAWGRDGVPGEPREFTGVSDRERHIRSVKFYHGIMRAGLELALEEIDTLPCGMSPAQHEGWSAARAAVTNIFHSDRPPQPTQVISIEVPSLSPIEMRMLQAAVEHDFGGKVLP